MVAARDSGLYNNPDAARGIMDPVTAKELGVNLLILLVSHHGIQFGRELLKAKLNGHGASRTLRNLELPQCEQLTRLIYDVSTSLSKAVVLAEKQAETTENMLDLLRDHDQRARDYIVTHK